MSSQIDHLLTETRRFSPSSEFAVGGGGNPGTVRERDERP